MTTVHYIHIIYIIANEEVMSNKYNLKYLQMIQWK